MTTQKPISKSPISDAFLSKNAEGNYLSNGCFCARCKNITGFSFTGKELDSETGYSYFGARYLDHELMTTWLSVDPMADKYPSISPYAYCAWNPVKLVDPDGSDCTETDIINKYNGKCIHIEDGKNRIVILDNKSFQHIQSFKVSSYEDMTHLQRITISVLMAIGVEVTLNSTLGKMARAVYAEMGDLNSSEQDRCIVAATIATRLKTDKDIDKVLVPKQYNAVSSNVYKIGFYNEELRLKKESPFFYSKNKKLIEQVRLQSISAAYRALNGLLPRQYNNVHSFVSKPCGSDYFDGNTRLLNVTASFTSRREVTGVWKIKRQ